MASDKAKKKIGSPAELNQLREQFKGEVEVRGQAKDLKITVHMGTCGIASGARDVLTEFMDELGKAGVEEKVMLTQTGCQGLCDQEPMVTVADGAGHEITYGKLDKKKVREIVRQHVVGGTPVVSHIVNPPQAALNKGDE